MEAYLNAQREELADREDVVAGIRVDDDLRDGDELFTVENSIHEVFYKCQVYFCNPRMLYINMVISLLTGTPLKKGDFFGKSMVFLKIVTKL
jgi:hypothetical protein